MFDILHEHGEAAPNGGQSYIKFNEKPFPTKQEAKQYAGKNIQGHHPSVYHYISHEKVKICPNLPEDCELYYIELKTKRR